MEIDFLSCCAYNSIISSILPLGPQSLNCFFSDPLQIQFADPWTSATEVQEETTSNMSENNGVNS